MTRHFGFVLLLFLTQLLMGPDAHAQIDDGVTVFSLATRDGNNNIVGECGFTLNGDLPSFYSGLVAVCNFTSGSVPQWSCGGAVSSGTCNSQTFQGDPNTTYTTTATHTLFFPFDDVDEVWVDEFDYLNGEIARPCNQESCTFFGVDDQTVFSDQFDGVEVALSSYSITTPPIDVSISPDQIGVIPGLTQQFTAQVTGVSTESVTWQNPTGNKGNVNPSGLYTAPAQSALNGQSVTDMVKACSTVNTSSCGTATVTVDPVTITVSAPSSVILATPSTTLQFNASVGGIPGGASTAVNWSVAAGTGITGSPGTIDATAGLYTVPSTAIANQGTVNITACLAATSQLGANQICSQPFSLTLSPPVIVTGVSGALNSGQSNIITISGSGFGTSPNASFNGAGFTQTGTQTNTSIPGIVSISSLPTSFISSVTVTSTSNPINSSNTPFPVTYNPVAVTVQLFPTSFTLLETQSQSFAATVGCKTASNNTCAIPATVTCSLSPNLGSVTQGITTSCNYTATATVTGQQPQLVQLTAKSTFNPSASGSASITLTPLNVTVSPSTGSIDGGQTKQFAANVIGALNNNQNVNWSISKEQSSDSPPPGSINSSGLYTAPNPITTSQTILVVACSQIDSNVCGQAQLTLTPISVTVSPSSVSLNPSATQQFSATVLGATNTQVKWSMVSGPGQIDPNTGIYTAPPPPNDAQQTATVQACTTVTPPGPTPCGTANVILLASPDFSVSVSAAQLTQTVTPGGSASYTITITPLNGYTGTVNFANCPVAPASSTIMIAGCPNSVTITNSNPASFQVTATSQPSTTVQNYTIGVSGNDSSLGVTRKVTLNFDVVDFTIAATPNSASVSGGGTVNYTISIAAAGSNGFGLPVCFTVSGQPTGITPPPPIAPSCTNGQGTSTFTLAISNTTQAGTYPLTITGTSTAGGTTDAHTVSPAPVLTVAPTVNNLSVASGVVGTSVTITGTNFGSTASTITFGGVAAANITNWTNTSITAVIPVDTPAGADPVVVTVNSVSSNNNVTLTVFPHIAGVSATVGTVNTPVTLTGSSFGSNQNGSSVTFSGVPSTTTVNWSDGSVTVLVPSTLTVGTYNMVVTVNQTVSDPSGVTPPSFTVVPGITSLSPASGPSGTSVTVGGTNLGSPGTTTVTFNGTTATPTSVNNNSIVVPVPNGLQPGPGTIVVTNGLSSNPASFTVTPNITSINPSYGPVGTSVTITGSNFGSSQGTVTFNGTTATVNPWSNATLVTTVPAGVTTGPVVVTGGGVPSSGTQFIVTSPETFYLTTVSSSVSGLMTLNTSIGSAASLLSQDLSNQPAGNYLIQAFNTATGVPGSSNTWPAGLAGTFTVWMSQTAGTTGTLFPEVQLYLNSTAGTPICTAIGSTALTTTNTQYTLSCAPSQNITLTPTGQYYLWVGVDSTSDPSSTTKAQLGIGLQVRGRPASSVTVPIH